MGATKTITGVARTAFDEFIRDVQAAIRDAQITPEERALILQGAMRTNAALVAADNRMRLIRFATGDVQRVRSIEDHAARNNITPLAFDFGPEPEAA